MGHAKSVIRHLGPSYTVDEIIAILTQEYEGVASSDVIFKDFYQLRQEKNEKVQVFSIRLRDMLTKLSIRFPDRVPKEDHDKILKDRFFYGIKSELRNSIRHLYDNETIIFSQLLVKARRNEEEESASRLVNKNVMIHDNTTLEQRVEQIIIQLLPHYPELIETIVAIMVGPHSRVTKDLEETINLLKWTSDKI